MKYIKYFFDSVFILAGLYLLICIGHEIYIGGSKIGNIVIPIMISGYLVIAVPYLIGRLISRSK